MIITSSNNSKIKEIKRLNEKKYRDTLNLFLVEGEHLVYEAYKKNQLVEILVLEGNSFDLSIKTTYVSENVMKSLSKMKSIPKIVGVCKKFHPLKFGNRLLILDNLQDPGNVGTIIRSCAAFNIDTIILSDDSVDLYNDKVIRSSEGQIFNVDIMRKDIREFIPMLKNNNYTIFGTNVDGGTSLSNISFEKKFAIVIGNEGQGISEDIKVLVDKNIYIPMSLKVESLNAAVATSIILYEMSKNDYE